MDNIIDGKALALKHQQFLQEKITKLGIRPKIVSILVGDDPASVLYTQMKQKKASQLGIDFDYIRYSSQDRFEDIAMAIVKLNQDRAVSGIMVQLPLPKDFLGDRSAEDLLQRINPEKDVDGLTKNSPFLPAAVRAVMSILEDENIELKGKFAAVLGMSRLVGLPIANELKKHGAIVSSINSQTPNIEQITSRADVIISATGKPRILTGNMVKNGVVVIDVGTLVIEDELSETPKQVIGDVDFESVFKKASKITPVPGGVGPMTVISLLENVVEASERAH